MLETTWHVAFLLLSLSNAYHSIMVQLRRLKYHETASCVHVLEILRFSNTKFWDSRMLLCQWSPKPKSSIDDMKFIPS